MEIYDILEIEVLSFGQDDVITGSCGSNAYPTLGEVDTEEVCFAWWS